MSETLNPWRWQGFEGPMDASIVLKQQHELLMAAQPPAVGLVKPDPGLPPLAWNKRGTRGMHAVQVRPEAPLPVPEGFEEADEALVGRLIDG